MAKLKWVVQNVKPTPDYQLILDFADGSRKCYDAKKLLEKPLYRSLKSVAFFMQAHVDGPTVAWNEQIDIAPETLYEDSVVIN